MKGKMKKIIVITLLIQIVVTSLIITPSYATPIEATNGNMPTSAVESQMTNPADPTMTITPWTTPSITLPSGINPPQITEPQLPQFTPSITTVPTTPTTTPTTATTTTTVPTTTTNPGTASGTTTDPTEADPFSKLLDGLAGILVLPVKILPLIVGKVLSWLMNAIAGEGLGGVLSVEDILFNNVAITGINFFELNSGDATVDQIRRSVSIWYYSIRNLAAILLVVIIVYVGIRMALSTIAEDKAKYKQMLMDWITGLALLFVLHYLMVAIVSINNVLVDLLKSAGGFDSSFGFGLIKTNFSSALDTLFLNGLSFGFTKGLGSALCYALLVGVTFLILISYIKRMITIAFLIVIAPLVTVTYSIDKMGDSKSQALNTWLKEFTYNILIQPFQCVTYLALAQTAISTLDNGASLKAVIIAIAMLIFVLVSEKIIKHIFHFESKSMSDTLAAAVGGATLISLASKAKSGGGKSGGGGGGDSKNKFANPQESMTTPTKNPSNVNRGGNPNRQSSGSGSASGSGSGAGTSRAGSGGSGAYDEDSGGSPSRTKKSKAATIAGKVAGKWMTGGLKAGAALTGAMLGLGATGSVDKGMIQGGILAKNSMQRRMDKSETNKKRRNLARAYNNYANEIAGEDPNLTAEQVNAKVRQKAVDMMEGKEEPLTDDERELQRALNDMSSLYTKRGMNEEEKNEAINNDFDGIESGAISETSAPMKFVGNIKDKALSRRRNRNKSNNGRWGFGNSGQGQAGSQGSPSPRPNSSGGNNRRGRPRNSRGSSSGRGSGSNRRSSSTEWERYDPNDNSYSHSGPQQSGNGSNRRSNSGEWDTYDPYDNG